jgi:hypothetical protein
VETVAAYWEAKVKTYGFHITSDLCLLRLELGPEELIDCGSGLIALATLGAGRVHFITVQCLRRQRLISHIAIENRLKDQLSQNLESIFPLGIYEKLSVRSPVDMIHFQGPHFGDRYGIAGVVFKTLEENGIPLLLAGCSGSTAQLVFPHGKAEAAKQALEVAFEIPKKKRVRSKKG